MKQLICPTFAPSNGSSRHAPEQRHHAAEGNGHGMYCAVRDYLRFAAGAQKRNFMLIREEDEHVSKDLDVEPCDTKDYAGSYSLHTYATNSSTKKKDALRQKMV